MDQRTHGPRTRARHEEKGPVPSCEEGCRSRRREAEVGRQTIASIRVE
jgi:hypothetical protein